MAGGKGGSGAVLMALGVNLVLTGVKLAAYLLSGSGAMLAETVHSAADFGNQALLWVGLRQSQRGPSKVHPFGYGKDRFLWALISAAGIFFIGCGVSVTHGLHDLFSPPEHHGEARTVVWAVLGISFILDGAVLVTAIRALDGQRNGVPWSQFLRTTEDTTTLAVLFEDGAAALGVVLAAAGILLADVLHLPWLDAVAAILIGLLLGGIAIFLGATNRTLLLDRAIGADAQARVLAAMRKVAQGSLSKISAIRTRIVGQDLFSFNADVEFDGKAISDRIVARMDLEAAYAKLDSPQALDALLDEHARVVVEELGHEVDRIEAQIREQVPGAKFIQIEVD